MTLRIDVTLSDEEREALWLAIAVVAQYRHLVREQVAFAEEIHPEDVRGLDAHAGKVDRAVKLLAFFDKRRGRPGLDDSRSADVQPPPKSGASIHPIFSTIPKEFDGTVGRVVAVDPNDPRSIYVDFFGDASVPVDCYGRPDEKATNAEMHRVIGRDWTARQKPLRIWHRAFRLIASLVGAQ